MTVHLRVVGRWGGGRGDQGPGLRKANILVQTMLDPSNQLRLASPILLMETSLRTDTVLVLASRLLSSLGLEKMTLFLLSLHYHS